MERQSSGGDVRMSINPARGAARGPWLGCVWSVSFKGGTAGRAITDDLPLAAGPGATLTESNHKQVNSTSTFLIFFSPCLFLLVSFCLLRWNTALSRYRPPPLSSLFWKRERSQVYFQCLFKPPIVWLLWSQGRKKKKGCEFSYFLQGFVYMLLLWSATWADCTASIRENQNQIFILLQKLLVRILLWG